jgi:hypothetical protein
VNDEDLFLTVVWTLLALCFIGIGLVLVSAIANGGLAIAESLTLLVAAGGALLVFLLACYIGFKVLR